MKKKGEIQGTNQQLAVEHNTTARQISKSRKRGWITNNDGVRVKYKAPMPVFK
tara:strand:+ start:927 stop:1085 length:159 start_codon:yes stop_codon:yes gene_type:complete